MKNRNRALEKQLLAILTIDDSGFVVYDGPGPASQRTGSQAQALIDWYLYRNTKEKPLDAEIFEKIVMEKMKNLKK